MPRKALIVLVWMFLIKGSCFSLPETEVFKLSMDGYLRTDIVTYKNIVDLDSSNSDDTTTYLGIDYSLGFGLESKNNGAKFYLKLERNGPGDYSAPLFVHNTLMNSGGRIEAYRNEELLPNIEEFWLDTPLFDNFKFKTGLYTYEVGNGFSLNGSFENYGFSVSGELENFIWRLYYCRPDLVYKNSLGPRIRQDEEQGYDYNPNASNFFATDIKFTKENTIIWPYIGVLADYTSSGKRDNAFTAPIKRDLLGTVGFAFSLEQDNFSFNTEIAHNFGKAESDSPDYEDIYHTGYLAYAGVDYTIGKFVPSFDFLLISGNKVSPEAAGDETLTSGKNRAFSYYSPLNNNLGDSISSSNVDMRPIVFTGCGCGLNYGIPRPGTLAASDFDNLIMPALGFDFNATEKLSIGLYGYYLRSFAKPVGMLNGEARYLSKELGYETDLFIDYQLNKNTLCSILGGYFFPGRYYKEERDDTSGSLLSPFVRGDGEVNPAYQIELSIEFQF